MADPARPPRFDRELVRRYDRPGPRYTSYPTAPHFHDGFGAAQYQTLLGRSAGSDLPLSLYVHIPFCARRCFFCGCNVVIARDRDRARRYLQLVEREAQLVAQRLAADGRGVVQVHWGGGTPNFLPPDDLVALAQILRASFAFAPGCEFGVEIDPRDCSEAQLDALAEAGVNRLSVGVQDVDPAVQRAVNRVQPQRQTRAVVEGARARGIASVNVDLIYGLPLQTAESFGATVAEVLTLAPDRLAVFNFAYLPAVFAHQRTLDPATLPDPATKLAILERAVNDLVDAGYVFIGMDHFARPGDSLAAALAAGTMTRNFQGYSTHAATDLVGLGVSSISQVAGGFAQNVKTVHDYQAALEAGRLPVCRGLDPSTEDLLRRDVIMSLMCRFGVDKTAIAARHAIDFDAFFAPDLERLAPLAADGLVELEAERLAVTPAGRFLVRNVAMAFDAYLESAPARYSRTV